MNLLSCGFYCIAFIEYILARKTLLDHTNLFFSNDYKNNDKIIQKYSITLKFRLRRIDETRNYFLEEIKHSHLVSQSTKRPVSI